MWLVRGLPSRTSRVRCHPLPHHPEDGHHRPNQQIKMGGSNRPHMGPLIFLPLRSPEIANASAGASDWMSM